MFIVKNRIIFYIFSILLIVASVVGLSIWGLQLGIDFKGGSLMEVSYTGVRPDQKVLETVLDTQNLGEYSLRPTGEAGFILKTRTITEPERVSLVDTLSEKGKDQITVKRFNSIGPLLGAEAARKSLIAIVLVILFIVLFITFAFRKVSQPVASWKYGLIAVLALAHDVIIPTGVFAFLGHFAGYEVDTLFVTAILVVLGFSIHDTIVVFDRVRENLTISNSNRDKKPFSQIVGESINQTFVRSINTSLTTILALVVLYFVGAEATRHFSLTLIIGIITGTYSSIFLGSTLLVTVEKMQKR
ncbi:MAG: protein translocase subunit SecF [Candidatus Paceibacterota bacterium]|jgi:preprotein translocase subunit SecF